MPKDVRLERHAEKPGAPEFRQVLLHRHPKDTRFLTVRRVNRGGRCPRCRRSARRRSFHRPSRAVRRRTAFDARGRAKRETRLGHDERELSGGVERALPNVGAKGGFSLETPTTSTPEGSGLLSHPVSLGKKALFAFGVGTFAVASACGQTPVFDTTVRFDGGDGAADAKSPMDSGPDGPSTDPTLGGPCTDDGQCGDGIECTFDRCDKTIDRCRNTPDDTQCADTVHCNGKERCVPRLGCRPGEPVTCQDGNSCTIDACVEETKSCVRAPRDVDGDGEADDHCEGGSDCDDIDPLVGATRAEICGNGKDDNCNRRVDEQIRRAHV